MSTGAHRQQPAVPEWTVVEHGSFAHGVCVACGFVAPARRARAKAERDVERHREHCPGPRPDPAERVTPV